MWEKFYNTGTWKRKFFQTLDRPVLASGKVGIGTLHAAIRTKVDRINIGNPGAEIDILKINVDYI